MATTTKTTTKKKSSTKKAGEEEEPKEQLASAGAHVDELREKEAKEGSEKHMLKPESESSAKPPQEPKAPASMPTIGKNLEGK